MTVADIARIEGVSERSAQRYCSVGFQGHVLPSVMTGKARSISEVDYKAWRVACGFDAAPDASGGSCPASSSSGDEHPASAAPGASHPYTATESLRDYPPYPFPADPAGELTNGPAPHSRNWPHPQAMRDHFEAQARRLVEEIRGDPNAVPQG